MKVLVFATLVVIAFLQLAWGKTLNKRSLGARQVPEVPDLPDLPDLPDVPDLDLDLGTCDADDLARALRDYPADCGTFDITGLLGTACTEQCGRPILDFSDRCGIDILTENLVYACSVNASGDTETCGAMLTNTLTLAASAVSTCLPGSESCSDACRSDLQALRSDAGCCGNFTQAPIVFSADISDFNLWNTCNVTVTGVCTEGAFNSGKGLIVTKITFLGLAVLAMVTMLL